MAVLIVFISVYQAEPDFFYERVSYSFNCHIID